MSKFQSIVEGIAESTLQELSEANITRGHWYISDGKLMVDVNGESFEFIFEKDDAESAAIVLMLNHLPYLTQAFRSKQ